MNELTRLLRDLVAIPGINPMGRNLQGDNIYEHRVTAYLEQYFRNLGVRFERQTVAPLRDNIIAWHEPANATRTLIFEAHQDTVPTDNMTIDPFGATIHNGKLYGRGACDIKGGMTAMLTAFARLVREQRASSVRVIMACTVDEEHTFFGVQHLARLDLRSKSSGPIEAVVAEPTQLDIVHAHKGAVRWSVSTSGRSCHSSRPELGINAIYHMATLLPLIERYAMELRAAPPHPLLGPRTLSVGRIEGGASVNTVPDSCRIEIDRRTLPGEDTRSAPGQLGDYLQRHAPGVPLTWSEPYLDCPALSPDGSEGLRQRLGLAINAVRGKHTVMPVPYGTDASTLALAGIPSVVFGPGDIAQAHTCDEWVELAEVEAASEILFRLATLGE